MKKLTASFLALFCVLAAHAAGPVKVDINATPDEKAVLEIYRTDGAARGAVVVCPGGAYGFKAIDKEGRDWAGWFADRGIVTAVLDYRLPQGRDGVPLADCSAAVAHLRENAERYGIPADRIGVMGFSAGGHLAATAATHSSGAGRPDFQILMYPVISMDSVITHRGSRDNLLGKSPADGAVAYYSCELMVTDATPPAFIFTCEDDRTVPPANSLRYYQALTDCNVPSELHVYPTGGHGYGKQPGFKYVSQMLYLLDSWIKNTVY